MPASTSYSGVSGSTEDSNGSNKVKCYEKQSFWKVIACICLISVIAAISYIIYHIYKYFVDTIEEREEIDIRIVYWKQTHSIDYETGLIQNCSIENPCKFNCTYLRENLKEEKKACEYDDWMDIWKWIFIVWGILVLCSCLCGSSKKATNRG
jgi:hypothetical protein